MQDISFSGESQSDRPRWTHRSSALRFT